MANGYIMYKNRLITAEIVISLLVIFLFMSFSCVERPHPKNLFGAWKGRLEGVELLFTFQNDGTCVLSFKDIDLGLNEMISGDYKMNFSKKPIPLDIRKIKQLNHSLYTIVEFTGDDSIKIAEFAPRWRLRPISFDSYKSMNLTRIDGTAQPTNLGKNN